MSDPTPAEKSPARVSTSALSGYIITILALAISVLAIVLGIFLIGNPGAAGTIGATGPKGADVPANYVPVTLTPDAPSTGSSYNGKYFFINGTLKVVLTALNCVAGDTFMIANPISAPITVSAESFSFPTKDFILEGNSVARCGVSGLLDGSLSLLCMTQAYTPA